MGLATMVGLMIEQMRQCRPEALLKQPAGGIAIFQDPIVVGRHKTGYKIKYARIGGLAGGTQFVELLMQDLV